MVGEARGTEEQRRCLFAARHDDTEVIVLHFQVGLFCLGHGDLYASEVFYGLPFPNGFAGHCGRLMGGYGVAVRRIDLEGTVGKIDVDIFPEMVLEVLLFVFGG